MNQPASIRAFGIEVKTAQDVGTVFALADGATVAVSDFYVSLIGNNPTFEAWEAARLGWREGYAVQRPDVKAESINRAWSRFAADLPVSKPKAASEKAQKVAAARAADPFKDKTHAQIEEERAALSEKIKAGDLSDATMKAYAAAADASVKRRKADEKAAEKEKANALKPRREAIKTLASKADADTLALMEAAVEIRSADAAARARAWARLTEAAGDIAKPTKGKGK